MTEQTFGHTFEEVQKLANQLDFIVTGGPHDRTFDMDKRGHTLLGGTWANTPLGRENAYHYLVNCQRSQTEPPNPPNS